MEKFMSLAGVGDLYMGEVFEYYDGPKLFTLNKKDSEEPLFLSYWIGDEKEYQSWVIIPVNKERISRYKNNEIDFLNFLNVLNEKELYRLDFMYKSGEDVISRMTSKDVSLIAWPKEGLYFNRK
ncbi:DUF6575 domain-containing protein [Shigella flexneri]